MVELMIENQNELIKEYLSDRISTKGSKKEIDVRSKKLKVIKAIIMVAISGQNQLFYKWV